jgi:hypothetical protein
MAEALKKCGEVLRISTQQLQHSADSNTIQTVARGRNPEVPRKVDRAQVQRRGQTCIGLGIEPIGTRRLGPIDQVVARFQTATATEVSGAVLMQSRRHVHATFLHQRDREPTASASNAACNRAAVNTMANGNPSRCNND